MNIQQQALNAHARWQGKIEVVPRVALNTAEDLALAYTPGVAAPCLEIAENPEMSFVYTRRWNTVAVVTDGSAVLGLGNIGPEAAMPVMEGKCALFKVFGHVDALPLCLNTQDTEEIVRVVSAMAVSFGGINLEDIAAPGCFEIQRRLQALCPVPVFHDDQHGTAVVVLAAVKNIVRLTGKPLRSLRVVINGAGAAGLAIAGLLRAAGAGEITLCDRKGVLKAGAAWMNSAQEEACTLLGCATEADTLAEAFAGADVAIGVSGPGAFTPAMVRTMAAGAAVLALANPEPEIYPEEAGAAGAWITGTGRSDFPNQVNNVLAFPGIFRGALDARAHCITGDMLLAAAGAIASLVADEALCPGKILPGVLEPGVADCVAAAVAGAYEPS